MNTTLKCLRCGRDGHLPADCKVPVLPDDRVLATGSVDLKAGRTALQSYLDDCDECSIVPDVAGAFHAGWQAGQGHASQAALTMAQPPQSESVPMPGDQIFRIARRLAPKVIDGMVYVPEWIVPLVRAVEESHGIVGKDGGKADHIPDARQKVREDFEARAESAVEAMKQAHTHLMFAAACNGVTVLDSVGVQETCEALHEAIGRLKSMKASAQVTITDSKDSK